MIADVWGFFIKAMEYYKNLSLEDIVYFCEIDNRWKFEQWKDVVGFEGDYCVSDLGRIKSKRYHNGTSERIITQAVTTKEYLKVVVYKNKEPFYRSAHRLVAEAFVPNPENKQDVGHFGKYPDGKEGNRKDNRCISLKWLTRSENLKHCFEFGRGNNNGINHSQAKLSEKQVLEIRASVLTNKELSILYKISDAHICTIRKRRSWRHI